jgi:hypothetical protein
MGWWYYIEPAQRAIELDLLTTIIFQTLTSIGGLLQASLMGLFFLMGGFLTPKSYDRKGGVLFWKERLIRLGIPLLLYILVVNPIMHYVLASLGILPWNTYQTLQGSFLDLYILSFQTRFIDFFTDYGPMWFLAVLLLFTALYTLWRYIAEFELLKSYLPKGEISIPQYPYLLLFAIVLGCGTFISRVIVPVDEFPLGMPFSTILIYLMMFSVGIIAIRHNWFEKVSKDNVKIWSITIVLMYSIIFLYTVFFMGLDADFTVFLGGFSLPAFLFALSETIIAVGMIFVLIPIFYLKLNFQGEILQKLSASAFHMYLIHAPILVTISLLFAPISIFPIIKLATVFPLTVIICYLISHYFLRKIL